VIDLLRNPIVVVAAILSLGAIEVVAIMNHIDGAYMAAVVAAIAGLAGYSVQARTP
jgi:hypothetical protein